MLWTSDKLFIWFHRSNIKLNSLVFLRIKSSTQKGYTYERDYIWFWMCLFRVWIGVSRGNKQERCAIGGELRAENARCANANSRDAQLDSWRLLPLRERQLWKTYCRPAERIQRPYMQNTPRAYFKKSVFAGDLSKVARDAPINFSSLICFSIFDRSSAHATCDTHI